MDKAVREIYDWVLKNGGSYKFYERWGCYTGDRWIGIYINEAMFLDKYGIK
jgi:hypothetical protein